MPVLGTGVWCQFTNRVVLISFVRSLAFFPKCTQSVKRAAVAVVMFAYRTETPFQWLSKYGLWMPTETARNDSWWQRVNILSKNNGTFCATYGTNRRTTLVYHFFFLFSVGTSLWRDFISHCSVWHAHTDWLLLLPLGRKGSTKLSNKLRMMFRSRHIIKRNKSTQRVSSALCARCCLKSAGQVDVCGYLLWLSL